MICLIAATLLISLANDISLFALSQFVALLAIAIAISHKFNWLTLLCLVHSTSSPADRILFSLLQTELDKKIGLDS